MGEWGPGRARLRAERGTNHDSSATVVAAVDEHDSQSIDGDVPGPTPARQIATTADGGGVDLGEHGLEREGG